MKIMILATLLCFIAPASAHDQAQWIQDGNYKNSAGELCCGLRDCAELPDGSVTVTTQGYHVRLVNTFERREIVTLDEVVPFSEAQPSPDGKYWRCQWGGERKCFFAPPPST